MYINVMAKLLLGLLHCAKLKQHKEETNETKKAVCSIYFNSMHVNPPEEARRILKRLEIHYTPKHGSWLDIAEIELNVMTRQCLSRRIAEIDLLRSELSAWEAERNTSAAKVNWHFRTNDARIKLSSLYPRFTTA